MVPEVEVALIPDLVRDYGPERALKTLWEINDAREHGVIGVGLGGSEQKSPRSYSLTYTKKPAVWDFVPQPMPVKQPGLTVSGARYWI